MYKYILFTYIFVSDIEIKLANIYASTLCTLFQRMKEVRKTMLLMFLSKATGNHFIFCCIAHIGTSECEQIELLCLGSVL
ncbi:hypothetical protein X975_16549, partial [Stegodyphus mimosarum]